MSTYNVSSLNQYACHHTLNLSVWSLELYFYNADILGGVRSDILSYKHCQQPHVEFDKNQIADVYSHPLGIYFILKAAYTLNLSVWSLELYFYGADIF